MTISLYILITSTVAFIVLCWLFGIEDRKERRIIMPRTRMWLDRAVSRIVRAFQVLADRWSFVSMGACWQAVMHRCIKVVHRVVVTVEQRTSQLLTKSRAKKSALQQSASSTHLRKMQEHKEETALTEAERNRRRAHE